MRVCKQSRNHTHSSIHSFIYSFIHPYAHTHIHTYIHTLGRQVLLYIANAVCIAEYNMKMLGHGTYHPIKLHPFSNPNLNPNPSPALAGSSETDESIKTILAHSPIA